MQLRCAVRRARQMMTEIVERREKEKKEGGKTIRDISR